MKIEITWNQPGGSIAALPPFSVNPNDPHKDDVELQVAKAKAAAQALLHKQFGSAPSPDELSVKIVQLEVGTLMHMLKVLSEDADVSQLLSKLMGVPAGTITAAQAIKQCEVSLPSECVSHN